MAAFRILNQFPVYLDTEGRPASGGYLAFYESGTTTPKDVYGDPDLSTNNGNTVALLSDGRTEHDIWGDGAYRVRLYAADDTLIDEADDVEVAGGDATSIPALTSGYFLTNNGSILLWAAIREVPDPTGQSGKTLGTDGTSLIWQDPPAEPDVPTSDSTSFQIGNFLVQTGTGSASNIGATSANGSITFGTTYSNVLHVTVQPTGAGYTSDNRGVTVAVSANNSGASVYFTVNSGADGNSDYQLTQNITFSWVAFGIVA